jgi:hypothetical protein
MKRTAFVLLPVLCLAARADDPPPTGENERVRLIREQYLAAAKKYEFFLDPGHKTPLTFDPKPIFHWTSDNDWSGDLFVWTAKGRPQVVGGVLSSPSKPDRTLIHEFHTLAAEPLAPAEMPGKYVWAPSAGVEFKPFAGTPAAAPAGRLPQMRAISRDLHAHMRAEDRDWKLRLLPQPIHRYQPTEGDVIDGTLFAYVWSRGTDPELLLAVECHRTPKGLEWRYAPVRFTTRELWLTHGDREVWRDPVHREDRAVATGRYTTRVVGKIPPPPAGMGAP